MTGPGASLVSRRTLLQALTAPSALALAAACRRGSAPHAATTPVTLVTGIAQPRPGAGLPAVANLLSNASLVVLASNGRPLPALASHWTVSDDGRTWRFTLRDRLVFHDGSPLDADAVRAGLQPDLGTPGPFGVAPGLRDVVNVTAESRRVLRLDLRTRSSFLLEALALMPISRGPDGEVGAGPFIEDSREPGRIVMRAFDGYYLGRPAIARVDLRSFSTPRVAWSAMLRGEIDFLYEVAPEAVEFIEATSDVQPVTSLRPYVYLVGFNLAHPVLAQTVVRQALNLAVNRNALIAGMFGGRGQAAASHVWPRHWAFDDGSQPAEDDPARARTMIEAAIPKRHGSPSSALVQFSCLVPSGYPMFERLAIFVQRALLDIGVDMQLVPIPQNDLQRRLASGDFEAYLLEMVAGFGVNWPYWFWHAGQDVGARYVSSGYRALDEPLDAVRMARPGDEERTAVRALDLAMRADPPALFLCWTETARAVRRTFTLPKDPDRDAVGTIAQWRPARLST